jgi:protein involved in polysaccharide export with SLBB domain
MNIPFLRLFAIGVVCWTTVLAASGQVDPELLRKARAAGVTQEQIDAIFSPATRLAASELASETALETSEPADRMPHEGEQQMFQRVLPTDWAGQSETIFGQSLFRNTNLTFTPDFRVATPKDYTLGPGDEVIVEVWGAAEANFRGKISAEGTLSLSGIGPVPLGGYTIDEATQSLRSRLRRVIAGIGSNSQIKVSLGEIRSIHVHILGEAAAPGTYTLPALATVFNALYLSGGPGDIGSLRDIRVMRHNEEAARVDIYQTLIDGQTADNIRLEEGDVILIPPYHARVQATGEVKRALGYELREGETLADLLRFAGGFSGEAYRENLTVRRKDQRQYRLHSVGSDQFDSFLLQDGDSVAVDRIISRYANRVSIRGAVWRPGEYELGEEMNRLSQLISQAENLKGDEFGDRGQITRLRPDFTAEIIPFSVQAVARGEADVELRPEDEVYIPSIDEMTETYYIIVRGEVNRPDTLPFRHRMTVEDVIIGSGGLKESASMAQIEVARRIKEPVSSGYSQAIAEVFTFPISEALTLSSEGGRFTLQPFDEVYIRRSPSYFVQQGAVVSGEILMEGNYTFSRVGERLSELIAKAGGVTPEAYIKGASLTRALTRDERAKVEAKLAMAKNDLRRDSLSLSTLNIASIYSVGIDLEKALKNPGGSDDIVLRDGDEIYIPRLDNTVKISGAVLQANAVTFDGQRLKDYISQAGGYTDSARRRPYIVYMNGKIASTRRGFPHKRYPKVEAGCEIIVPERAQRGNRLGLGNVLSIASSSTAIAALIATLLR